MDNIILNSLDYFFERREKYNGIKNMIISDEIYETMPIAIVNGTRKKYNLIGITINGAFTWAWHLNISKQHYIKSKQLLFYAINKDIITLQDAYIKTLLTTDTHDITNDSESKTLLLIIALALYLTKSHSLIIHNDNDSTKFYGLYDINDTDL
jgi:hypothetical protein